LPKTQNFEIVETNIKETTEDNGKLYKVTSKLTIKELDVKHGGSYTCSSGKQQHSERLDVYGPPTPREVLKVETKEGYALTLQCPMGGYPLEDATWNDGNGNPVESDLGELKFENIKEDEKGIYTCTMKNKNTLVNATAKINLNVVKDIKEAKLFPSDVVINVAGACGICGKSGKKKKDKCTGTLLLESEHKNKWKATNKTREKDIQVWDVYANKRRNKKETTRVKNVYGTCCWKVVGRDKRKQIFRTGQNKVPNSAYFKKIYAGDCKKKMFSKP